MASPSIISNDRLDKDFYIVVEDFRDGAAFRETDEGIDHSTLIEDLLTGQYDRVLRVVAFNPVEGWSRDASEDIAHELEHRISANVRDLSRVEGFCREPARTRDRRSVGASAATRKSWLNEASRASWREAALLLPALLYGLKGLAGAV
ncbi:hypothetical protein [Bradyrhizobium sp. DASA03120]|uniref:hypothetical protein n=1 Tax=Bradyrhizobium sp. SMVTL-02 TaxID=3395917 RepID=UPI003F70BF65